MAVPSFATVLLQRVPPWLRRAVARPIVLGFGDAIDTVRDLTVEGAKARLPSDDADPTWLAAIGRERRIRRGEGEPDLTYARRLRGWWDAHRRRGNTYVLLEQLFAFWRYTLNVPIDVVAFSGLRHSMDVDGAIVRDQIAWSPSNPPQWAQIWVIFRLGDASILTDELVDDLADGIIDESEDPILIVSTGGSLSDVMAEQFRAIPREWTAAHIRRTYIVLLYGTGELWDYPGASDDDGWTWDEWAALGGTVDQDAPVILLVEA